jgi:membrane protein implicated in regulation of membrane protease activity
MSVLHFLFAWANAPFTIAVGIALLFSALSATGLLGLFVGGVHGDGDADGGHDGGGHDADGDHAGHDTDDADEADNDADQHASLGQIVFGTLGVGKIPLSIVWQVYAVVFGVAGLALNTRFLKTGASIPTSSLFTAAPFAVVVAYAVVALIARITAPLFATKASEATARHELVGHDAVVISSQVTSEFGEVRIRDKSGHDLRVVCKLAAGARTPREHEKVVVVDYEDGHLRVAPFDDDESPRKRA